MTEMEKVEEWVRCKAHEAFEPQQPDGCEDSSAERNAADAPLFGFFRGFFCESTSLLLD